MKGRICLLILVLFCLQLYAQKKSTVRVDHLRCNYRINPMGTDEAPPKLSWQIASDQYDVMQSAYRILVADNEARLRKDIGNIWDSGKITSGQSLLVNYRGKDPVPSKRYFWKVKVWDNKNNSSGWSEPAIWQTGLFSRKDWTGATWIGREDNSQDTLPLFRKDFTVKKKVKRAVLYISGLGHFEASLNGEKIGNHFLDPGWTDYDKHALYLTFDLTDSLKHGANAIGVMLGNGFYHIPPERYRKFTGSYGHPKMICRLFIKYQDGTIENIVSNSSWKTSYSPITFSSIYGGEDYDARLEQTGWNRPHFNDVYWQPAIPVEGPPKLDAQTEAPLKVFDTFHPVKITQPRPGTFIYDMGQNASGIPGITVSGKRGDSLKIIPGELLDDNGLVTQKASGGPSYFVYKLKGGSKESWQPRFTYYGFRYLQVEGAVPEHQSNSKNLPVILNLTSLHTRNAAPDVGDFASSNELFNKTNELIDWAIKSNMASVMTDCPHREKLGWLEEVHLMGSSVRYNYEIATLLQKIIRDMQYAQLDNGLIPDIAPEYVEFKNGFRDSPEWGSSGIIVPWYLYQWYGDSITLKESYPMMRRYAEYLDKKSQNHILTHGLGDWFDIGPEGVGESQLTPKGVTSTAIYYYDLQILVKTARLLGEKDDAKKYVQLGRKVKEAFNEMFFNKKTNQYATGSQTSNAMAVYMGLVEPEYKKDVIENLIKDIRKGNNSITAGDVGFRYVLRVLENADRSDIIYDMNSRSDVPGYGYQLAKGATSLTESWQAYRFVSNNHFMLGHLMEWFYSGLAGIRAGDGAVAFNKIVINPQPVGDVTTAKATYNSPYGIIFCEWKKENGTFELNVEIPPNTTAEIYLPASETSKIFENGKEIKNNNRNSVPERKRTVIAIGSGKYRFLARSN